jgi:pre-mRNA-processing factor 40
MATINGISGPPALWQEARNAEGRVYYYNVQTKATQWVKPLELMTPAEVSDIQPSPHLDHILTFAPIESLVKSAMEGIHC